MNKILVVEDSMLNINILKQALGDQYQLFVAKNGQIALNILEKQQPDVILLDITMPVMDGYETYENIVKRENLRDIPVVFLTAREQLEKDVIVLDPSRFIRLIKKPFDIPTVEQTIEKALRSGRNE